jgi:P-type Cu2+ transporter
MASEPHHGNHHDMNHSNDHNGSGADHQHHADHTGHEQMFRQKFWWSLVLSIPVILYSSTIQQWLGFSMPEFNGSQWITLVFAVIVFFYGGLPFLKMAIPEIQNRKPGMMMLISLAILVAFIYSIGALFISAGKGFFWELVTLIDIMLLGHWIEMRSVR